MNILHDDEVYYRPCCALLKEESKSLRSLSDSAACMELLECMAEHCALMKIVGNSRMKIDEKNMQCYLLVEPVSARKVLNEVSETITLEGLTDYYSILNQIESSIAQNPLLKEVADHHATLLRTLRKKEKKFGAVPAETIDQGVAPSPELLDSKKFLVDHPRLGDKPQFDGVPPKQTPIPNDNPDSSEQVNRLQNQHQPKPAFNPRPQM